MLTNVPTNVEGINIRHRNREFYERSHDEKDIINHAKRAQSMDITAEDVEGRIKAVTTQAAAKSEL